MEIVKLNPYEKSVNKWALECAMNGGKFFRDEVNGRVWYTSNYTALSVPAGKDFVKAEPMVVTRCITDRIKRPAEDGILMVDKKTAVKMGDNKTYYQFEHSETGEFVFIRDKVYKIIKNYLVYGTENNCTKNSLVITLEDYTPIGIVCPLVKR